MKYFQFLYPFFLIFLLALVMINPLYSGSLFLVNLGPTELELEFDPYYIPLGWTIPLTTEPIPKIDNQGEQEIYGFLMTKFLVPRFIVLEGGIYPMPLIGAGLKHFLPSFYNACSFFEGFNLIDSITTGPFMEPWSASLFAGNVVNFVTSSEPDDDADYLTNRIKPIKYDGKGYRGFLVSYGSQHIRYNTLVPDHWLEFELKLKGVKSSGNMSLSWSYRAGYRLHLNNAIKSFLYAGFRRNHMDNEFLKFSILKNSFAEFRVDMGTSPIELLTLTFIIGKKFPLEFKPFVVEFNAGCIFYINDSYNGTLSDGTNRAHWKIVLSPNLKF